MTVKKKTTRFTNRISSGLRFGRKIVPFKGLDEYRPSIYY